MKTSFLTLFGAAFLAVSASYAGAPAGPMAPPAPAANNGGFFIGVDSGAFWLQDSTVTGHGLSADVKYKTGWGITAPVGYDFGNGFSLFLTGGYDRANVDSLSVNAFGRGGSAVIAGADAQFIPIMANASYDLKLAENFSWYLGAGLGTVAEKASSAGFDSNWDWEFGFQAFTGFSYHCTPNCSINLGYRFMYVNDGSNFDGFNANSSKGHTLEAGLTFKF